MVGFTKSLGKIGHMWQQSYAQCSASSLHFETASNNLIGLLTVGAVIGSGVTITNYVIEWRLGSVSGPIGLITGVGSDPDIQSFHPIVSEPIIGGVYYAVIRYIDIDGIRYSPYFLEGQSSPDLLTCLGSITVITMDCTNGSETGSYSHIITYVNNLQPANNASRSLKFILGSGGVTSWFAWQFLGFAVADRLTIYYVHITDEAHPVLMSDWVIGSNATTNFTSSPKVYGSGNSSLKMAMDLSPYSYQEGDYLLINVTPRYFEPTQTNTNWTLNLKCLTGAEFTCSAVPDGARVFDASTASMTWNSTSCRWEFKWHNISDYIFPITQMQYIQYTLYNLGNSSWNYNTGEMMLYLRKQTQGGTSFINRSGSCITQSETTFVNKTGSTLTFTFPSSTYYDIYKARYDLLQSNSNWINYTIDDSSINHFKYYILGLRFSPNCGDAAVNKTLYFHHDSSIVFDNSTNTITMIMQNTGTSIVPAACDSTSVQVQNIIYNASTAIASADFDLSTNSYYPYVIAGTYVSATIYDDVNTIASFQSPQILSGLESECVPSGWYDTSAFVGGAFTGYVPYYAKIELTNPPDPSNNYRVTSYIDASTGAKLTVGNIIYEVSAGIVIIP